MTRAYLDHNATSPIRPEAAAALAAALADGGNASSVHADGRRAKARLEAARAVVARALGRPSDAVVFTSGGVEAINLALLGAVEAGATHRLLISAIEHDAVRAAAAASGAVVETIPVQPNGVIDLAWLESRLESWNAREGRPFVALMLANNETGVVQPVAEAAALVRAASGLLLVDAVQAVGKIDVDAAALGADYLVATAHKLGGPPGVGALALGPDAPFAKRAHGGGQESGRRAGTENIPAIAGFAAALEAASSADYAALAALRDDLEARVTAARPDVRVMGADAPRLATTSCLALPGFRAETQVMALDLAGVAVSAGAACSSGKVRPSHVLEAMGAAPDVAGAAIRVSLGWTTTAADVDAFVAAYLEAADRALGAPVRQEATA